jgi:glycosyltransferase involved in cell wall biosynthesis
MRIKPDIIYAHDFFLLFPGWLASRITRAKLVYDAHELIVPDDGHFRSLSHRLFHLLEHICVRHADLVIAANQSRAAIMKNHYNMSRHPIVVRNIPSSGPTTQEHLTFQYGRLAHSSDRIRLLYQGIMSRARGLDVFIRVLPLLGEQYELIMVGDGPGVDFFRELAIELGVSDRVVCFGRVPADQLPGITRQCSIGIVSYSFDDPNQRNCAPNKVYEYAQAGIPLVATGQDVLRELVGDSGIGVILPPAYDLAATVREYAAAIRYVANHRHACIARIPEFLSNNNWDIEKTRLKTCFTELYQAQG